MFYVLGIDAGGTKTVCQLADEHGTVLAEARAAGANLQACETAITTASVAFTGGVGSLTLAAPGSGNNGSVLLTPQLGSSFSGSYCPAQGGTFTAISAGGGSAWLLGRWNDNSNPDSDAQTAYDDKPAGRISFDIYGAQPGSFIFNREIY